MLALQAARRSQGGLWLEDRVCLVVCDLDTPGLTVARHLLWRGARVAVCSVVGAAGLDAARELLGEGRDVMVVACDAGDPASSDAMLAEVTVRLGPIEVLVGEAQAGLISSRLGSEVLLMPLPRELDAERGARRLADALEANRPLPVDLAP